MRRCSYLYSSTLPTLLRVTLLLAPLSGTAAQAESSGVSVDLSSTAVPGAYTLQVEVGTPAQTFNVEIDTGSSNLILLGDSSLCDNCGKEIGQALYSPSQSSSAQLSDTEFSIQYGLGALKARQVQDKVVVGALPPLDYTFGVMTHQAGIQNILGLAYKAVARPQNEPLTPYFDDIVSKAGLADELSILLCDESGSKITFGASGVQASQYVPIVKEKWYIVPAKKLRTKNGKSLGKFSVPTVIDSGTTELTVPQRMHDNIMKALSPVAEKNGVDLTQELIRTTADVIDQFPVLQVVIKNMEGQTINLDISPRTYFKPVSTVGYLLSLGVRNDQALLGQVFMKNYHVVFDRANKRIGFGAAEGCAPGPR